MGYLRPDKKTAQSEMREQIADIVGGFIASLPLQQPVLQAIAGQNSTLLEVADALHLRAGMQVLVDGTPAKVLSVSAGQITAEGVFQLAESVVIPPPQFLHGTPISVNIELGTLPSAAKFPAVYLYEILRDRQIFADSSPIERECEIILFFLDNADPAWLTDAHYDNTVRRMDALAQHFLSQVLLSPLFAGELIEYADTIPHADFGRFAQERGHIRTIFDEMLSGVELRLKLPIKKKTNCIE